MQKDTVFWKREGGSACLISPFTYSHTPEWEFMQE
jgi:hypothetical protein